MELPNEYAVVELGALQRRFFHCADRVELFKDDRTVSELNAVFENELADSDAVLSLDIFDTFLLRDNSSELSRFLEIGEAMSEACINVTKPTQFEAFLARHLGTEATYRAADRLLKSREGSLREIHLTAARLLNKKDDLADDFVECEISFEASTLTVNPFLLNFVENYKSQGGMVILITDMYFHAEHIIRLLKKMGIDTELFDKLFSSADEKLSKASGLIFEKVMTDTGRCNVFHVGDNFRADYLNPRRAGWRALHLPISRADVAARQASHDQALIRIKNSLGFAVDVKRPE